VGPARDPPLVISGVDKLAVEVEEVVGEDHVGLAKIGWWPIGVLCVYTEVAASSSRSSRILLRFRPEPDDSICEVTMSFPPSLAS